MATKKTVSKKAVAAKPASKQVKAKQPAPKSAPKAAAKPAAKAATPKKAQEKSVSAAKKSPKLVVSAKKPEKRVVISAKETAAATPKKAQEKSVSAAKKSPKLVVSAKKSGKKSDVVISIPAADIPVDAPKKNGDILKDDRPSHHIAFSLEDLDAFFKNRQNNVQPKLSKKDAEPTAKKAAVAAKKPAKGGAVKLENKSQGVATIFDILGFNPVETPSVEKLEGKDVPKKWKKYYNKLVELRQHHTDGVATRSEEVMKRSAKDDAGDLSSYGQHLADAGSGSFERDLAYNMISNQTEILAEIDAAIKRIKDGTYGICEVTGKPIPEARLEAIPFARYTREGQEIHERDLKRQKASRRDSMFEMGMEESSSSQKSDDEETDSNS